jgi:DNA-binding transcriptional LysR family regulator
MSRPDLNLLVTLDVLLTEGSVARAARKLRLSPSAMSRALARLRETTGDPLLVRAGRGLVPTPRALELAERTGALVREAEAMLRPVETLDLKRLARTFTIRSRDGFVENFGPDLIARVESEAPGVRLVFVPKLGRESAPLRDGSVDMETGVATKAMGPELRTRALFRDRVVGVVRAGHVLCETPVTLAAYAAGRHVVVHHPALESPAQDLSRVDELLEPLGLTRTIVTVVGGFSEALALARASDLIATVPERYTGNLRDGMASFALPFAMEGITISLLWHPRMDADPAHRWLRGIVRDICAEKPDRSRRNDARALPGDYRG